MTQGWNKFGCTPSRSLQESSISRISELLSSQSLDFDYQDGVLYICLNSYKVSSFLTSLLHCLFQIGIFL